MYLVKTPYLLKKLYPPSLVWNMPRNEKVIYLTFDDGPIPGVTPWVLETLKQYQAKATFFCIGDNVRKHPDIYRKVLEEGHAVGNHTFNHLKGWKTPDQVYLENIGKCAELVTSRLFRPPYGRIRGSQIRKLRQTTYAAGEDSHAPVASGNQAAVTPPGQSPASNLLPDRIIMWDVLSGDFDPGLSPEKCLKNVLSYTENGSIVVFHDSLKAEKRLRFALPEALAYWKEKDFQLKRLAL